MKSWAREQLEAAGVKTSRSRQINPDSENAIQANFFEWVAIHAPRYPDLELFHAVPNSAKRGKMDGWVMKLTGTRKGVPDVHLPVASGRHIGLWFEFKSEKGRLSPEQKEWIDKLIKAGHRVEVVRSWVAAANITIEYLGLDLEKL
jgi:hypothetical protein